MQMMPRMKPRAWVTQIITGRLGEFMYFHQGLRKIATGTKAVTIMIPRYPRYFRDLLSYANFFSRYCPSIVTARAVKRAGIPNPIDSSSKHLKKNEV